MIHLNNTSGLHIVRKKVKSGDRWYVYARRGGPLIHTQDKYKPTPTPQLVAKAQAALGHQSRDALNVIIDAYRASPEYAAKSDKTKLDYRHRLTQISAQFGRVPARLVPELGPEIIKWRDSMASTPRAADRSVGMLHTVIRWGKQRGMVKGENPAADIPKLHKANRADLIWEDRHWQSVQGIPGRIHRVVRLGSLTGLRMGDLLRLAWEDVQDGYIALKTSKTGGEAVIPLHLDLSRFLTGPGRGVILRNSLGNPWTLDGFETSWRKARPVGFDRRLHDLRGTFATRLMIAGFSDSEIAIVLGWETKRLAVLRARYVDRTRVAKALAERLRVNPR